MNIEAIEQLAALLARHGLTKLEVIDGALTVKLEKNAAQPTPDLPQPIQASPPAEGVDFSRLHSVRSPVVGVFYEAASPDAEPYVHIGSRVQKGDVLCIVEAMKVMNEITAEHDGEVVDICVKNGDIVEFGQPMFKLK